MHVTNFAVGSDTTTIVIIAMSIAGALSAIVIVSVMLWCCYKSRCADACFLIIS